jgi:hypothetical protein
MVAAGLACELVALVGAWIASEYVQTQVFSWLLPALVGVATGGAAAGVARPAPGTPHRLALRLIAVVYALVATGLSFRLVVGHESAFHPAGRVGPPYLAAAVGAWLWTTGGRRRGSAGPRDAQEQ